MDENRDKLLKKLADPAWLASKMRKYDEIVNSPDQGDQISITLSPSYIIDRTPRDRGPVIVDYLLPDEPVSPASFYSEPTTIDELWLDRWQLSSGGYTITRMDDTIRLDYPEGQRYVYRVQGSERERFWWVAEEFSETGNRIHTRQTTDRFTESEEALFDMHRAALSDFEDLTNLI